MQLISEEQGPAGRIAAGIICALVSLKLVIFAAFAVSIVQASSALAKTDNPAPVAVCTGNNLMPGLKASDPQTYNKIEQAARNVANGQARFWKVEKAGLDPSWLLGTMHFSDPRVVAMPPVMEKAFQDAKTVVIENTQILDEKEMLVAMAKLRPLMFFTDGTTLEKFYDPGTIDLIKKRLVGRNVPYFLGKRMQPWVLATSLVLPMCELERKRNKLKVLDYVIGTRARAEGKNLVGLESVTEQIGAMASLPFEFHLKSLEETLKLGSKVDDVMVTMVELYLKGDIGKFWPLMQFLSPQSTKGPGSDKFKYVLITRRNKIMAERSQSYFTKGGVFMAVGALHLPDKTGVVQALKNDGYKVTPVL